jgi:putative hemolysin
MKNSIRYTSIVLALTLVLLAGCQAPTPATAIMPPATQAAMANPASENCIKQGGTLQIEDLDDQGQIGVCYFEDNRQCEEWALMRGDCPVGGVKVTGYVTEAGRYCAITGGQYTATGNNGAQDELGTCTFKNGTQCNAWDYYYGRCTPETAPTPANSSGTEVRWQPYADAQVGYTIKAPSTWSQGTLPDQNNIHGESYSGVEGGVEIYWGTGFGGACPGGTEPVQLVVGELQACHTTNANGTEEWTQISYQVDGGNSFSVRAYTSNSQQTSHDLVLQTLATIIFRLPGQIQIDPMTMELCDGRAQAMAQALNVLEVTQSDEFLEDPVNNGYGTGCQALATGTGTQYQSPDAVVKTLGAMLVEAGWTQDPNLAAGSATGEGEGYRKDNQICEASAIWQPDPAANCPADQPISACNVPLELQDYSVTVNCGVESPVGVATATP